MADWRDDPIGSALRGENPTVMARMRSGFACIGDHQLMPGYSVLMTDDPANASLTDLTPERRLQFLADMAMLGEAITDACRDRGLRRINYEIQGNTLALLHAHVFPRYDWETPERAAWPVVMYPHEQIFSPENAYDESRDGELRAKITAELERLMSADHD